MIRALNLTKKYGDFTAVSDLSFEVAEGEVVGLLGPNAAGKTTTMRMLTTFLPPTGGSASVAGFDICKEPQQVRHNIGYLPETPPLYPELRVIEYLRFVASIRGVSKVESEIDQAIERTGLGDVRNRLCSQLSKGYRQRVGLAQAIVHKPKVIILDEPTSGLDPAQIIEIRKLVATLRGEHTVILSTHILPEVTEICSRVIIVARGRVVNEGTIEELTKEKSLEEHFMAAVSSEGSGIESLSEAQGEA